MHATACMSPAATGGETPTCNMRHTPGATRMQASVHAIKDWKSLSQLTPGRCSAALIRELVAANSHINKIETAPVASSATCVAFINNV